MTEKKCGKCIHFIQYVGDCTGECEEPDGKKGWIGTDTPSCVLFWNNTDICLICKHWIADKFHGKTWHYGKCVHQTGFNPRSCDSFCHRFERREDYKEYLQRLIEGEE